RGNLCKFGRGIRVDAFAELVQTRSVLAFEPVEPGRRFSEGSADVARLGALRLALAEARDRFHERLDEIDSPGGTFGRMAVRDGKRLDPLRDINGRSPEDRQQ